MADYSGTPAPAYSPPHQGYGSPPPGHQQQPQQYPQHPQPYQEQPQQYPQHSQPYQNQPQQYQGQPQSYPQQHPQQSPMGAGEPHKEGLHNYNANQQQQQQQEHPPPMQGQAGAAPPAAAQGYQTAVPINALGAGPAPIDCPACGMRQMTRVELENGNTVLAWAAGLCFCFCLGCIPFCISSLKDVVHYCGHCGTRVATFHRSSRTEQHVHR